MQKFNEISQIPEVKIIQTKTAQRKPYKCLIMPFELFKVFENKVEAVKNKRCPLIKLSNSTYAPLEYKYQFSQMFTKISNLVH